jgi:hypothetical protein
MSQLGQKLPVIATPDLILEGLLRSNTCRMTYGSTTATSAISLDRYERQVSDGQETLVLISYCE